MEEESLSIVGEKLRYDFPIVRRREYLTTQKIPIIRRIYEKAIRQLYDQTRGEVTVIGYLKPTKKQITQKEQKSLKDLKVDAEQVSKYALYAESSKIQSDVFVFAEPYKVENFFLPFECTLTRISENTFYLKRYKPTYLKAEGLELEKPNLNFSGILSQFSQYSHYSKNSGKHIFRSLAFPYIGCDFCKNISDGFGVSQMAEGGSGKEALEVLLELHRSLNNDRLGVPFNDFGVVNLIGEKDMKKVSDYRTRLRGRAKSISWLNPCNEKEVGIIKLSEMKYFSSEPVFFKSAYRDLKNNLDLRYSLLLYGLRQKEQVKDSLWRQGIENATKVLGEYARTPREKKVVYGTAIDPEKIPLLVGRTLSLSNAISLDKTDSMHMLDEIVEQNLEEITLNLSKEAQVHIKTTETIDPKILAKIVLTEDKTQDGVIGAIKNATGWSEKRAGQFFSQMVNDGHLVTKEGKYTLVNYSDFNLDSSD